MVQKVALNLHSIFQHISFCNEHITAFPSYSAVCASWKVEAKCVFKEAEDHIDLSQCVWVFPTVGEFNLCPISGPNTCKINFHIFSLKIHAFFCNYLQLEEF